MAQHDYIIANQSGAAFRADLNNGLAAIVSQNSGAAQPSTTYAYQWWADTTTGLLKLRNGANNAWITIGTLGGVNLGLLAQSGGTLTGALLADNSGTAALPAIAFDGDPDTGIFRPGANQVAISTNGVQRINIEPDGDINIDSGGVFYNATDNRLAIGTTSPAELLHISSTTADAIAQVQTTFASGDARLNLYANSGGVSQIRFGDEGSVNVGLLTYEHTTDSMAFRTNGSERTRIDSSGRLLVGTSSSIATTGGTAGLLQIHSATGTTQSISNWASSGSDPARLVLSKSQGGSVGTQGIVNSAAHIGLIRFAGDDGTNFIDAASISAFVDGTPGTNDMPGRLVFSTTADGAATPTERMRIDNAGNVGIGTASPLSRLHVDGLTRLNSTVTAVTTTDSAIASTNASANTGDVSFESVAVSTATRHHISFVNPNGVVGSITTNASATAYVTSSDYRLKENVVLLTGAIDRLQQIPVHRFNFIADPDTVVDGFIAHEAQAVVPECATGSKDEVDDDGNPVYQGIDQSKLVPLLTAALQEAIGRIETLEAEVAALKGV